MPLGSYSADRFFFLYRIVFIARRLMLSPGSNDTYLHIIIYGGNKRVFDTLHDVGTPLYYNTDIVVGPAYRLQYRIDFIIIKIKYYITVYLLNDMTHYENNF